jgi:hypothetical protein
MHTFSPALIFWYIFPIILLIASKFIIRLFALNRKFKLKTPDLVVPFLFLGIHTVSLSLGMQSILPFFFLTILLLGIVVTIFQIVQFREIVYPRFFKMFWRLTFLLVMAVYFLLDIFSILSFL